MDKNRNDKLKCIKTTEHGCYSNVVRLKSLGLLQTF